MIRGNANVFAMMIYLWLIKSNLLKDCSVPEDKVYKANNPSTDISYPTVNISKQLFQSKP